MAMKLLEVVRCVVRPEEEADAFEEFYRVCLAGVESYQIQKNRMEQRMKPSMN